MANAAAQVHCQAVASVALLLDWQEPAVTELVAKAEVTAFGGPPGRRAEPALTAPGADECAVEFGRYGPLAVFGGASIRRPILPASTMAPRTSIIARQPSWAVMSLTS
jgi:hypothetical protein